MAVVCSLKSSRQIPLMLRIVVILALIKASIWLGSHGISQNRLYMAKCDIGYVEFKHHRNAYEIDDTGWKTTAVHSGTYGFSLDFPTRTKIGSIGREQSLRNESLQMSIAKSLLKFICDEIVIPSRRLTAPRSYVIKWSKSRVPHHTNSLAGFHINLSGDVESNPGPNLSHHRQSLGDLNALNVEKLLDAIVSA